MVNTKPWHVLGVDEAAAQIGGRPGVLTSADAAQRLEQYGPNELQAAHCVSPWAILLEQFKNVLVIILLIATALSLFLGHGIESMRRHRKQGAGT